MTGSFRFLLSYSRSKQSLLDCLAFLGSSFLGFLRSGSSRRSNSSLHLLVIVGSNRNLQLDLKQRMRELIKIRLTPRVRSALRVSPYTFRESQKCSFFQIDNNRSLLKRSCNDRMRFYASSILFILIDPQHPINLLQMSLKPSPDKSFRSKPLESIKYPLLTKLVLQKRSSHKIQQSPFSLPQPKQCKDLSPQAVSSYLMREKFDGIYSKIQEMTNRYTLFYSSESSSTRGREFAASDSLFKVIHAADKDYQQFCKLRTSHLLQKKESGEAGELEINTVSEGEMLRQSLEYSKAQAILRRSRYHSRLKPVDSSKLSNNLHDYLSVERMSLRDNEEAIMSKAKIYKRYHLSNLFDGKLMQLHQMKLSLQKEISLSPKKENKISPERSLPLVRKVSKFKPPFELYYYRDFLWKISFSNENVIEIPQEYPEKIKFYVGGGNNSNLIKGLMKRRPWFQITDKVQDAQLVWTQIKVASIFTQQGKSEKKMVDLTASLNTLEGISKKQENFYKRQYSVLNELQNKIWSDYWNKSLQIQKNMKPNMHNRSRKLKIQRTILEKRGQIKVHNHFCNNFIIGNKKALFQTMSQYYENKGIDVFSRLPLTFHIKSGLEDQQYLKFLQSFYAISKANKANPDSIHRFNAWIVKPGENTNRGNGITVCLDLNEIKTILKSKEKHNDGTLKTYILQKYIQKPLLYKRRKFDIRHYMMLNCCNGIMKGYWYRHGYVRTTSSEYTLKASGGGIHLTNDAVQKYLPDYGKYEKANKITYEELEAYIKKQDNSFDFFAQVYPKMKQLATDAIHASALNIDPQRRLHNFQIFGMDFMIDELYNVWLIEINTNPCLQTNCPVLSQIIPRFIDNTLQICVDTLFPPPLSFAPKLDSFLGNPNEQNNLELIFDERIEKSHLNAGDTVPNPQEEDDTFDDDGQDFTQQLH